MIRCPTNLPGIPARSEPHRCRAIAQPLRASRLAPVVSIAMLAAACGGITPGSAPAADPASESDSAAFTGNTSSGVSDSSHGGSASGIQQPPPAGGVRCEDPTNDGRLASGAPIDPSDPALDLTAVDITLDESGLSIAYRTAAPPVAAPGARISTVLAIWEAETKRFDVRANMADGAWKAFVKDVASGKVHQLEDAARATDEGVLIEVPGMLVGSLAPPFSYSAAIEGGADPLRAQLDTCPEADHPDPPLEQRGLYPASG